jgi:hypothetical protein
MAAPTVTPSAANTALRARSLAASCETSKTLAPGLIMAATWRNQMVRRMESMGIAL